MKAIILVLAFVLILAYVAQAHGVEDASPITNIFESTVWMTNTTQVIEYDRTSPGMVNNGRFGVECTVSLWANDRRAGQRDYPLKTADGSDSATCSTGRIAVKVAEDEIPPGEYYARVHTIFASGNMSEIISVKFRIEDVAVIMFPGIDATTEWVIRRTEFTRVNTSLIVPPLRYPGSSCWMRLEKLIPGGPHREHLFEGRPYVNIMEQTVDYMDMYDESLFRPRWTYERRGTGRPYDCSVEEYYIQTGGLTMGWYRMRIVARPYYQPIDSTPIANVSSVYFCIRENDKLCPGQKWIHTVTSPYFS